MITGPTAASYTESCWDEATRLLRESEWSKWEKRVWDGATMVPLVMTMFGTSGTSAVACLQSAGSAPLQLHALLATGVGDRGLWLRIAKQ